MPIFNKCSSLWRASRESKDFQKKELRIVDGFIVDQKQVDYADCGTSEAAEAMLIEAGWIKRQTKDGERFFAK